MEAEKGAFPVGLMAGILGVSRSGFYAWLARPGRPPDPWAPLRAEVESLWAASGGRWGARTVRSQLGDAGAASLYRVRKCMRELGIRGIHPRASRRTTVADPLAAARPDLIRRDFDCPVPTVKLVGDITYLATGQGWLYMAVVIDLCTRMVVGLSFSERMTADLPIAALESARARGYVAEGAIFHSDYAEENAKPRKARFRRETGETAA